MSRHFLPIVFAAAGLSFAADGADWIERLGGTVKRDAAKRIVAVNLRGSWINDGDEINRLAELPALEALDLSHTRITDEGLLRLKPAPRIRDLSLFYAEWITDQGMSALRGWKHLKRLNVRGTRISDGTLALIGKITGLEALDIAHTSVTDNGLEHLITLVRLKELALGRGRLTYKSLRVLRMLPTLTSLDLSGARPVPPDMGANRAGPGIPEEALQAVAELKELRVLKLGHTSISGSGLHILGALDKLERLGLEGCRRIDDAAAGELTSWKSLKYLDLQDTQVTQAGVEALRKTNPGLAILALTGKPTEP